MATWGQLLRQIRQPTRKKDRYLALEKCPQKKGTCLRVFFMSPKKPNSAVRKATRVSLSNRFKITAYIAGEGHNLQKHSTVLIRGGRVRDLPGVRYKVIRGKHDLRGVANRRSARSKYGIKSFKQKVNS